MNWCQRITFILSTLYHTLLLRLVKGSNKTKSCSKCGRALNGTNICTVCPKRIARMFHPHNGRNGFDSCEVSSALAENFLNIRCSCTPMVLMELENRVNEFKHEGMSNEKATIQMELEYGI